MKKGNLWALAPILVFLVLYIGIGVYMGDFYVMPAAVGFLIALLVSFFQNPDRTLAEKLSTLARGAGDENIMIMCLIFLLAGAFSGSVKAAGGADAAVAFGLAVLPSRIVVVGLYLIGCFISTSMGTSVGTIVALQPIAMGISEQAGIPLPICIASVVCGAMFGDNLSMISDTTIAAARTQGCEMRDKFRENFRLVLPAAIVTAVLFFVLTLGSDYQSSGRITGDMIVRIVPYLFVLIGALAGLNVILLLSAGTVLSLCAGLFLGDFVWSEIFGIMNDGMSSMFEITVISILVAGMVGLIRENGGIDWLLTTIRRRIHSRKGAELGIAALSGLVDCSTANNTVAIVIAGPIAKEIADEYGISAQRTASLLDIFTSVFQGLLPYGVQILYAANAAVTGLTPFDVIPYCFYPMLMAVSAICFILFAKDRPSTAHE